MAIGTWNKNTMAIEVTIDATATQRPILMGMFSGAPWQKRFDLLKLEGDPAAPSERFLTYWNNCDPNRLHFTFTLAPGSSYRIRPSFLNTPCGGAMPVPATMAPTEIVGVEPGPVGQPRMEMFEWDFAAATGNPGSAEKAAIILVLVDNNVGPGVGLPGAINPEMSLLGSDGGTLNLSGSGITINVYPR